MRKITKRSAAVIAASVVGLGALGGVAMANGWFADGTATGTAASSKVQKMSAVIQVVDKVYPGAVVDATATVTNPNDFNVAIDTQGAPTFTVTAADGTTENTACQDKLTASSLTVAATKNQLVVKAKSQPSAVPLKITAAEDLDEACADSRITMTLSFSGKSTTAPANV